eukprot:Nk52_evm6s2473 gene=Nk52_evmTU6s2473
MNGNDVVLFLFCKYPVKGKVKTRLIPAVGEEQACLLAESFLLDILHKVGRDPLLVNIQKYILFTPQQSKGDFEKLLANENLVKHWSLIAQRDGYAVDLGEKLKATLGFVREVKACGAIYIGMDSPHLGNEALIRCAEAVVSGKAFIKGATDGGYVLLGVHQDWNDDCFDNIRWSCKDTYKDQLAGLRRANPTTTTSSTAPQVTGKREIIQDPGLICDVDDFEDLQALKHLLLKDASLQSACPRSAEVLKLNAEKSGQLPPFLKISQLINLVKQDHAPDRDLILASKTEANFEQKFEVEFKGEKRIVDAKIIQKMAELINCSKDYEHLVVKNEFYPIVDGKRGQMFQFCAKQISMKGSQWDLEGQTCPHLDTCVRLPINYAYPQLNFTSTVLLNSSFSVKVDPEYKEKIRIKTLWSPYDSIISDIHENGDPLFQEIESAMPKLGCKPFDYNALLESQRICALHKDCTDSNGNAICGLFDSTFIEFGGAFVVPYAFEAEFFQIMYGRGMLDLWALPGTAK